MTDSLNRLLALGREPVAFQMITISYRYKSIPIPRPHFASSPSSTIASPYSRSNVWAAVTNSMVDAVRFPGVEQRRVELPVRTVVERGVRREGEREEAPHVVLQGRGRPEAGERHGALLGQPVRPRPRYRRRLGEAGGGERLKVGLDLAAAPRGSGRRPSGCSRSASRF